MHLFSVASSVPNQKFVMCLGHPLANFWFDKDTSKIKVLVWLIDSEIRFRACPNYRANF
jgi:hypothetical protein